MHLVCPALPFEYLGVLHVLELRNGPPDLTGHISIIQVGPIGRAVEWRAETVKHTGGLPCQAP